MAFSPQSDRLAIAQSDNMVFVYKIGLEWGEKKSICNKFQHSSSISCLAWPTKRSNDIVYGLAEGKVKIGQMKTHKPATLYQTDSYVTAMCCNPEGNAVVSAHLDGSMYVFYFDNPDRGARMIARHSCVPFALAWGTSISVAGNNNMVVFYDEDGGEEQTFDMSNNPECKEFTVAASNPTGDAIVMGNFNSLHIFTRNKDSMSWEEKPPTKVENMYSVTAMGWKPDGDKLAVGTLCGVVDLYDICVRRTMYKGGFELTYVSHSQVIVRQVETNLRIVVRSQYGREIIKTNIFKNRFVVANTVDTILLGDLQTLKLSEIQWHGNGSEKYIFDNPAACIIYFAGEVSIVEYGIDEVLGSIRTSYTSPHVLSLRINDRALRSGDGEQMYAGTNQDNKKVAFLLDAQTICIKDLVTQSSITVAHDSKIDWLELNGRANLLLFRDKRRYLHLYNTDRQARSQLLNFCTYVQWVPNSDVVVAQNRTNLCVWYNINAPDQITVQPIKGDIEEIERTAGRTEVIVDEGISQAVYPLDESLIDFGTAIDDENYVHAMDILENLEVTPDVEAMWKQLSAVALASGDLRIAQRCAAAIGDVAMRKFLEDVHDLEVRAQEDTGLRGADHYMVRCRMSLLQKDLKQAENELLNQGRVQECIEMYQKLFKFEDAIRVAEQNRHRDVAEMRHSYYQHLLDTNQEERAAALKVREGDFMQAINLYLKGGMPGKAAQVILEHDIQNPVQLLDQVATALVRAGMHDKAGDFYERLNELQRALDSYIRGNAFRKAVELARKCFPARVVELQEQWGDYLVSQKQIDMAINHYIEAKVYQKAIEAALNARQYSRALQLVDAIDADSARPYYKQLARHYEDSRQYDLAEKCYVGADQPHLAVEMHTKLGHWEVAHKIAMSYMKEGEVGLLYINQAQKLEAKGRLKEAEKLYLSVKEKDLAINMYKKHRRFDDMVRLVQDHRPDLLKETHQFLAQTLEMEGSLKDAEHHYVEAQEWHSAVNMYRSNELWDDAIRVAKFYGGINACKRVTIALLMAIGVAEGAKYLTKHQLVEAAIEYAAENGSFDMAMELASQHMVKKLPELYLKHALFLEDDERFAEAEEEFIRANKPKEAIEMYVHQQDWANALRVAEGYDPTAIPDVYVANAKVKAEAGDLKAAEELYLNASRPELALAMYQEADRWNEALRLAQLHLPHRVAEVSGGHQKSQARQGKGSSKNDYMAVGRSLEQNKQWEQALNAYLNARANKIDSAADLEDIWNRAIEVARNFVPNRHVEVALEISRRLVDIKREEAAADVLFEVGRHEEAINICIQGKKYDKAKALAQGNPSLRRRVDEAYQSHLVAREDTTSLVDLGHSEVALDVLAKRGDWDRLWEVASTEQMSGTALGKYIIMRVEEVSLQQLRAVCVLVHELNIVVICDAQLMHKNTAADLDEAVRTLNKRGAPATESAISTYRKLVLRLLSRTSKEETADHAAVISMLRDILFRLANQYRTVPIDKKLNAELVDMLMATHYQNMLYMAKSLGLKEIAAKCSVTLLKYPNLIPHDKAFYQAGMACREQGNVNLAFLLLNRSVCLTPYFKQCDNKVEDNFSMSPIRYVDVTEAIDSADPSFLDNSEFQDADAIPLHEALPLRHYLDKEVRPVLFFEKCVV
jgi:intraflagellar transport protein 172